MAWDAVPAPVRMRSRAFLAAAILGVASLAEMFGPPEVSLRVWVVPDQAVVLPGDDVPFTIFVRNEGPREIRLEFSTSCHTSFEIVDLRGDVVYHGGRHYGCLDVLTSFVLAPGARRTFAWTWDRTTDDGGSIEGPAAFLIRGTFYRVPAAAPVLVL